jgi:prevent-host-death family protein
METIGAFEAKRHLSALLDRVAKGERITITRHGQPAALLAPVGTTEQKLSHIELVEEMRALRKRVKASKISVREMVNEGRRF